MFNFDILERDLGIVSPQYFVYDFSRKIFIVLYSINWPNFCAWLALLLEILSNMCIAIVCFPGCDDINFEINRTFLIKPFFYMTKKSDKYFSEFELNTERYSASLRIQSECGKMRTRITPNTDTFCEVNLMPLNESKRGWYNYNNFFAMVLSFLLMSRYF